MTFRLGLTGSIGMGKSTTAQMFAEEGCAIWDADAAVHKLYGPGGAAVAPIGAVWPGVISENAVSRPALKKLMAEDDSVLPRLERIVHPLVADDRRRFGETTRAGVAVFDIPLLFETGGEATMDAVACVWVAPDVQRQRVLSRGTMTPAQFARILANQMPIEEKRRRADYEIETDTPDHARAQVRAVMRDIRKRLANA